MQLKKVLERYYDEHLTYKVTDTPRVARISRAHLCRIIGSRKELGLLDHSDFRAYTEKRTRENASPNTIRREIAHLEAAARWGLRSKWLAQTDMPVVTKPLPSPPREEWLTKEQALELLAAAKVIGKKCGDPFYRLHLFCVIGLFTGARPGAIRYLKWDHVERYKKLIDFRYAEKPGSKKRYTRVRIMDELLPHLESAWKSRGQGVWVLHNTQDLSEQFGRAVELAKIPGKITPNTLRHTWATWQSQMGTDLFAIAKVLGNSVKVVEDRYAHWHPSYQREATSVKFFDEGATL